MNINELCDKVNSASYPQREEKWRQERLAHNHW